MLLPSLCFGMTKEEHEVVSGIVAACRDPKHYYSDDECFDVVLSTQIELPEWYLCMQLPMLRSCPNVGFDDSSN